MSLTQPNLYIDGQQMQTSKADPRPALAGLTLSWGTDSRYDLAPAAALSGQLLIRGTPPAFLDVGAPVGLVDPITGRTLFAGTLEPLTAEPEEKIKGSHRISFTAASPLAELEKHRVLDLDWTHDETAVRRRNRLAAAMPRGWTLNGVQGLDWINQGRQLYQSVEWVTLAERYVRGNLQRFHDTSTYVPGAGMRKRITVTDERPKYPTVPNTAAGSGGVWESLGANMGVSFLPAGAVALDMSWKKTPEDVITDVQVTSYGGAFPQGAESAEFEYLMSAYVNNDALQDTYGYRQQRVETALSSFNANSAAAQIRNLVNFWLTTQTSWRPTSLRLPDSRKIARDPLLHLLAADSRHMAAVAVPDARGLPAPIRHWIYSGSATWDGTKWITELTLGRKL